MDRWQILKDLLKDIVLTGLGVTAIYSQIFSEHPSGLILGTGLVLTVPSTAAHLKALLPSSGGGGETLPSTPQPGAQPSQPSSRGVSGGE